MTPKRKPKEAVAAVGPNRIRTNPVQIYLSKKELQAFARVCKGMRMSRAEALRTWINLADADLRLQGSKPAPVDARQMEVTELLEDMHG